MEKICTQCNKNFEKKSTCSKKEWATSKFCSHLCYGLSKRGIIPPQVKLWEKGVHFSPSTEFKKGQVSPRKGVKAPQSKEHYEKRVAAMVRGEQHWNWKGGITSENEQARKSLEYKKWHKAVLERDWFQCQECGYKGREIEVDHIKPFYLYPELRFEIDNGRTLCKPCHRKTDTWGRKVYLMQPFVVGQNA